MPKLPWTKWPSQVDVLLDDRLVGPELVASALTADGAASGPRIARAGSPGSTCAAKNTIMLRMNSVMIPSPIRLRMNSVSDMVSPGGGAPGRARR